MRLVDSPGSGTVDADFDTALVETVAALRRFAAVLTGPGEREDLVQDTLARAWARRESFDPRRGEVKAWVMAIMADQARNRWRAGRRRLSLMPEQLAQQPPDIGHLDIRAAVGRLSRRQRAAVILFYYVDLPVAEIATVLGCSVGTVKSTLSDARVRLSKELGEYA